MKKSLKKIPQFKNEDEERTFWSTHSSEEYFDWEVALSDISFSKLKPSTETISLRLPKNLLESIKIEANKRDIPYQSLIKHTLYSFFSKISAKKSLT